MKYILFALMLLVACTEKSLTPEGALKVYIDNRFDHKIESTELASYFTGAMLEKLSGMDEEDFTSFLNTKGLKKKKFKILSKSCEDQKCFLTYTLSYRSTIEGGDKFDSKVKKVVELWQEATGWKIAEINNIKTFHKAKEAINALED
jgi:hypothetical protein